MCKEVWIDIAFGGAKELKNLRELHHIQYEILAEMQGEGNGGRYVNQSFRRCC